MNFLEQLQHHFDSIGMTQVEIAEKLGVNKTYVNALFAGRKKFGKKQAEIWENLFGLSKSWLLTGEGDMLKSLETEVTENITEEDFQEISEKKSVQTSERSKERLIPFYDIETTGGCNEVVSASSEGALVGYIQPGGWFDGRETAAIRHVGDSMTEYPNGCVLAVKEVKDRHLLVPGRNYVIETSEYRITKRVQRGNSPTTLMLYSTNTEKYDDGRLVHEPFEIDIEDIRRIFNVLGYIVNQSGDFRLIKP